MWLFIRPSRARTCIIDLEGQNPILLNDRPSYSWALLDSNQRQYACKACALPPELNTRHILYMALILFLI